MQTISQSPTDPKFVQDPYSFYEKARAQAGAVFHWQEYDMPCALSYASVWAILRDRRFGREIPEALKQPRPDHQAAFWAVEDHSMLELEPPRHTRLRGLVLRAFTSRRVAELEPEISHLANTLLDGLDGREFDLIPDFAERVPVLIISRLLGLPDEHADKLLAWSHAMVGMYQAGRSHSDEVAAALAAQEFSDFLREFVEFRRVRPADDLITHLITAEEDGQHLSIDELISTCSLLLNAGHEATVHTIGNGVLAILENGTSPEVLAPEQIDATVEEILRYDPPLHMFQRWAYEDIEIGSHVVKAGGKIACLLGAANRDPGRWQDAELFDPTRPVQTNTSFGAGVHFCIGAPLARLELRTALPILFNRLPGLSLTQEPRFSSSYHFHGLESLQVQS